MGNITALLLLLLAPSAHAYYATEAEHCSTIDLRDAALEMPLRDQGDISWCYAHSSADYLQHYFKIAKPISAADVALLFNQRTWPRLLRWIRGINAGETGFARTAMRDVLEAGYCPEEYFPSSRWTKRYLTGIKSGQTESKMLNESIDDLMDLQKQLQLGIYKSEADLPYAYDFKDVSLTQFFEILRTSTDRTLLENLRVAACDQHRVAFAHQVGAIAMRPKGRNTFNRINALLETGTAVDIDYFYGYLEDVAHYSRNIKHLHSSVILGRRFDAAEGECRYMIRNSYGTDCSSYDPSHQCEGGYLWVTESSLYRAIMTYVYIKDPLGADIGPDYRAPQVSNTDKTE